MWAQKIWEMARKIDDNEKTKKASSRRKRGFQMREAELSTLENNDESNEVKEIKNDKNENNDLLI